MARFPRQEATDDRLAERLGAATEQLRVALEREAAEIIAKAREEAAGIEEEARHRAAETEQEALRRAEEASARADAANARAEELSAKAEEESARAEAARASHADRIARALRDVDAMEERLQTTVADLRRRLSGELDEIRPLAQQQQQPVQEPEAPPVQEPEAPPAAVQVADDAPAEPEADQALAFSGPVPLSVATAVDSATEPNPVLDDMMRAQILNMKERGAPREEAERFLARFRLGESYLGILDDIYSEHREQDGAPQGKRRRFRRRGS